MPNALKTTLSVEPAGATYITAPVVKCSECRKKFERLSPRWAYRFVKGGKEHVQCGWTCHRKAEARLYPKPKLRGEACAERRIFICGEKP